MAQMITRLDDEMHSRLKQRAAAENRSLNDLVVEALSTVLDIEVTRKTVKDRLKAAGMLVVPPPPAGPRPSREDVIASGRGLGTAVSEALAAERASR